jgi:hypothetical protein
VRFSAFYFQILALLIADLGLIIDRDYQKTVAAAGFTVKKTKGDDLSDFPIEKARLRIIWYFMGLSMAYTVGYGWSVERRTVSLQPLVLLQKWHTMLTNVVTTWQSVNPSIYVRYHSKPEPLT